MKNKRCGSLFHIFCVTLFILITRTNEAGAAGCPSFLDQSQLAFEWKSIDEHQGPDQPRGSWNVGSLKNATPLPLEGTGYIKLHRNRPLHWGTQELIKLIEKVGRAYEKQFRLMPDYSPIPIGNLSAKNGGRLDQYSPAHAMGLEVDVGFLRSNGKVQDLIRESFEFKGLKSGRVNPQFDLVRNWFVIRSFLTFGDVLVIFIDRTLISKIRTFAEECDPYGWKDTNAQWRLKHWPSHSDHMHVRMNCHSSNRYCTKEAGPGRLTVKNLLD